MSISANYSYSCFIPFHLTDQAGLIFFGHVFALAHQAFENFVVDRLNYSWSEWFNHPDWIVPIKHSAADYFYPLQAGQECHIEISLVERSTSSFTLAFSFSQEQLCCVVKTVHVFCSRQSKQKIAIPDSLLKVIAFN